MSLACNDDYVFNSTNNNSNSALFFIWYSFPDKETYQLANHLWVYGSRFVSAFSSRFHLQKVDGTENPHP
ncbi:hypothetical protein ACTXT7_013855 [Hymenolepis weldensis]